MLQNTSAKTITRSQNEFQQGFGHAVRDAYNPNGNQVTRDNQGLLYRLGNKYGRLASEVFDSPFDCDWLDAWQTACTLRDVPAWAQG